MSHFEATKALFESMGLAHQVNESEEEKLILFEEGFYFRDFNVAFAFDPDGRFRNHFATDK